MSTDRPFSDIIRARTDGGVDIQIDHPHGPLRWELPGERAAQLCEAIHTAIGGTSVLARILSSKATMERRAYVLRRAYVNPETLAAITRTHRPSGVILDAGPDGVIIDGVEILAVDDVVRGDFRLEWHEGIGA